MSNTTKYAEKLTAQLRELLDKNPSREELEAFVVKQITLPASARERHLYVCGGTGVGKSKLLEHCIWQDIVHHSDSKCGLILFDPHGLVYQNIMARLADHGLKRKVIPIDLRRDDWIISYNLLRRRKKTDPAVVVGSFVRAMAHVWGEGGTNPTPLFARWATYFLQTLYSNNATVTDLMLMLSRDDLRRGMIAKLKDDGARYSWQLAERNPKEFEQQITSTLNRFQRLAGPAVMKATFGQPDVSLDLETAIEEGQTRTASPLFSFHCDYSARKVIHSESS
jgi:hypothetical protein